MSHVALRIKCEEEPSEPSGVPANVRSVEPSTTIGCVRQTKSDPVGNRKLTHRPLTDACRAGGSEEERNPFAWRRVGGWPGVGAWDTKKGRPPKGTALCIKNRAMTYSRGVNHYHRREGLDCRVRNGNGYGPFTMVTRKLSESHAGQGFFSQAKARRLVFRN